MSECPGEYSNHNGVSIASCLKSFEEDVLCGFPVGGEYLSVFSARGLAPFLSVQQHHHIVEIWSIFFFCIHFHTAGLFQSDHYFATIAS